MINNTKEKRCPKGTRKDPKTNECVPYIKPDKKTADSKYHIEKAMGHGVRNQTEFIITNDFLYNTKNNYTRTDYNAVKIENLKQTRKKKIFSLITYLRLGIQKRRQVRLVKINI